MKDARDYKTERNTPPRRRVPPDMREPRPRRGERQDRRDGPASRGSGSRGPESRRPAERKRRQPERRERNRQQKLRNLKIGLIAAACVFVVLIAVYCIVAAGYSKKFLPHTYVNGFNVGRYSVAETEDVLKKSVEKYKLEIAFRGGKSEVITSSEMGLTYVSSNEVSEIMAKQKRFSWLMSLFGKKHYYTVSTSFQYDSAKLRNVLESLPEFDPANITKPKNSTVVIDSDLTFRTSTEFQGNQPNEDVIFAAVDAAVNGSQTRLSLESVEGAYVKPDISSKNDFLNERVKYLNDYLETEVTVVYRDGSTDVIGRERLVSWAKPDENGVYMLDDHTVYMQIYYMVEAAASKYNEIHEYLDFNSTNNGVVRLWCSDPWGYKINIDSQTEKIFTKVYAHEKTSYELQSAVSSSMEDKIGNTYIEVDITNQHVYYYVNGKLYMDTDCVTGLEDDYDRKTPSGAFAIFDLAEDMTLGSLTAADESQRYESFVDYWMPFYESYGLHDASWRYEFGGNLYTWAGSHGCVNLPVEFAEKLFKSLDVWTPVLVCRESDAAATSKHSLDAKTD